MISPHIQLQETIVRYAPRIRLIARSLPATAQFDEDDLKQEVWKRLAKVVPSFTWESSDGIGVILATAKRIVIDKARRKKSERVPPSLEGMFESKEDESPNENIEKRELSQVVQEAVRSLPLRDQLLISRSHFQPRGKSEKASGSDRTSLCRAIEKLRNKLRNDPRITSFLE